MIPTHNCQLPTVNCQLSTVNCQLPTVNCQSGRNLKKLSCLSIASGEMICSAASRQFHRN
ncbi:MULTISPECIES: hypothetical protein [unclassified Microcoleus]|uniref:hypothetical protein n=1 Tax=unclassified Microcoleus TaxID=2642155 RepID=UPI0025E36CDC|nr:MULTISPECIES: hypothetical protein [unclassified Microcoleus]